MVEVRRLHLCIGCQAGPGGGRHDVLRQAAGAAEVRAPGGARRRQRPLQGRHVRRCRLKPRLRTHDEAKIRPLQVADQSQPWHRDRCGTLVPVGALKVPLVSIAFCGVGEAGRAGTAQRFSPKSSCRAPLKSPVTHCRGAVHSF